MNFSNWSNEDDEVLIDFVRVHEMLFNAKHKDYRQTLMKQKLWCEVGEILNKTDTDCMKRWCYVRDYYIRRKGKPGTGSCGEAAKKRCNLLSFLDSIPSSQRKTITNAIATENPGENTENSSEQTPHENQETEGVTSNNEEDISADTYHGDDNNKGDSIIDENNNKKSTKDGNKKSDLKRKNNSRSDERLNLLKQIVNKKSSPQNEFDETDLFFSSMAKIVKKLPRYEQTRIRLEIHSLVGKAELRYIDIDSPRPGTDGSDYSETENPAPGLRIHSNIPVSDLTIPTTRTNTGARIPSRRPVPRIKIVTPPNIMSPRPGTSGSDYTETEKSENASPGLSEHSNIRVANLTIPTTRTNTGDRDPSRRPVPRIKIVTPPNIMSPRPGTSGSDYTETEKSENASPGLSEHSNIRVANLTIPTTRTNTGDRDPSRPPVPRIKIVTPPNIVSPRPGTNDSETENPAPGLRIHSNIRVANLTIPTRTNTGARVPSRRPVRTFSINEQGQIVLISQDNTELSD